MQMIFKLIFYTREMQIMMMKIILNEAWKLEGKHNNVKALLPLDANKWQV